MKRNRWASIAGDEEASRILTELYDKGHNLADWMVERILKNQIGRDEREDVIHDGFERLIHNVENLKGASLGERFSYMNRAMESAALDRARKLSQRKAPESADDMIWEVLPSKELTPEEQYIKKERERLRSQCLRAAMSRMGERDAALLTERYRYGRSDKEISERLGLSMENVRVPLSRARKRLAKLYKEEAAKIGWSEDGFRAERKTTKER